MRRQPAYGEASVWRWRRRNVAMANQYQSMALAAQYPAVQWLAAALLAVA